MMIFCAALFCGYMYWGSVAIYRLLHPASVVDATLFYWNPNVIGGFFMMLLWPRIMTCDISPNPLLKTAIALGALTVTTLIFWGALAIIYSMSNSKLAICVGFGYGLSRILVACCAIKKEQRERKN